LADAEVSVSATCVHSSGCVNCERTLPHGNPYDCKEGIA